MNPSENEFLAENEKIEIVPKFSHSVMTLIQGDVGPFKAGQVTKVPLWLAVMFKNGDKCSIETPEWLDLEKLEECREEERESPFFTALPATHIFEISNILLDATSESIRNADQIRSILKDIYDTRQAKLRKSVDMFFQEEYLTAKINHLQQIELSSFRPILPQAFDQHHRYNVANGAAARQASLASLNTSRSLNSSRSFTSSM